jgi:hypothetical protein
VNGQVIWLISAETFAQWTVNKCVRWWHSWRTCYQRDPEVDPDHDHDEAAELGHHQLIAKDEVGRQDLCDNA